jgi:hypothetical protein
VDKEITWVSSGSGNEREVMETGNYIGGGTYTLNEHPETNLCDKCYWKHEAERWRMLYEESRMACVDRNKPYVERGSDASTGR